MTIEELVKMPEPDLHDGITVTKAGKYSSTEDGYTADQLRAYGEAVAAAVAERCAQICMERMAVYWNSTEDEPDPTDCADAIRREFGEVSNG